MRFSNEQQTRTNIIIIEFLLLLLIHVPVLAPPFFILHCCLFTTEVRISTDSVSSCMAMRT